ncbi:alpha-1-antitrypsin homolog [Brachyistius frenatus]|uniref:alpha-1-antitrypsin homolog n=1 Tax=Brachyistius frenatus TaxID=100188 RepID=UPI0037E76A37
MAVKMRGIFACCVLAALLSAESWADHHHQEREVSCHKVSSFYADFTFALYKILNAKAAPGKNIFYSPLGISTALSMVSTGAHGDTHSQLLSSLGFSTFNQSQVNEAYKDLFYMLGSNQENHQLDVGNAVALRSGFNPLEKFLRDVRHYYSGEIFKVDQENPEESVAEINRYIANKTQDKIKDMVKDLDPDMVMVLINYVYFRGQWKNPFSDDMTDMADFHVNDKTKVQVNMMMRTGHYNVYRDADNHTTVVMLPYQGNSSMMIVLPDKGKMRKVEGYINKEYIWHWLKSVSKKYVKLLLPKFDISADALLEDALKEMGVTNAFEDNADFSGVSDKIKLSKVSHKATLSVTELGTEAAASTIMEFMFFSLPPSVIINRPFLVFILDCPTGNILFMGKINNPKAM